MIIYECKELEPILASTYGCIVYQEQVMQIVRDLAGYSYGRSDLVRRAMSKKKASVMDWFSYSFNTCHTIANAKTNFLFSFIIFYTTISFTCIFFVIFFFLFMIDRQKNSFSFISVAGTRKEKMESYAAMLDAVIKQTFL